MKHTMLILAAIFAASVFADSKLATKTYVDNKFVDSMTAITNVTRLLGEKRDINDMKCWYFTTEFPAIEEAVVGTSPKVSFYFNDEEMVWFASLSNLANGWSALSREVDGTNQNNISFIAYSPGKPSGFIYANRDRISTANDIVCATNYTLNAAKSYTDEAVRQAGSVTPSIVTNISGRVTSNVVTKAYVESLGIEAGISGNSATNIVDGIVASSNLATVAALAGKLDAWNQGHTQHVYWDGEVLTFTYGINVMSEPSMFPGNLNALIFGDTTMQQLLDAKANVEDISATNAVFSNAVLAVGLGISSNDVAVIRDMAGAIGDLPIGGGVATLGGLIAALVASVVWLKQNALRKGLTAQGVPQDSNVSTLFTSDNTSLNLSNVRVSSADSTSAKNYIDGIVGNINTALDTINGEVA